MMHARRLPQIFDALFPTLDELPTRNFLELRHFLESRREFDCYFVEQADGDNDLRVSREALYTEDAAHAFDNHLHLLEERLKRDK